MDQDAKIPDFPASDACSHRVLRDTMSLQTDWWVSISPRDAELAAAEEEIPTRLLEYSGDVENLPKLIDLPGGPEYGKRPILGHPASVDDRSTIQADCERLPFPYLTYAKIITIPPEWNEHSIFLHIDNARYHVDVRIDGREVARYVGGLEPHKICIDDFLSAGSKILLRITVGDSGTSGHREFDVYNYSGTRLPTCREIQDNLTHPVVYGGRDRAVGKVSLEAVPRVRINWVFANPIVSSLFLKFSILVVNDFNVDVTAYVKSVAIAESGDVKLLVDQLVDLCQRSESAIREEISWRDAILWDTDSPHRYKIVTSVTVAGKLIDTHTDHFGFREFSINGHSFYLNGRKIHLHGQSGHILKGHDAMSLVEKVEFFRAWKSRGNVNHVRLHAKPQDKSWVEAADICGMLLTTETALWTTGFHSFDWCGSELECYHNVRRHFLDAIVRRDRNNPSVVIWSLSNEMSPIIPYDLETEKMAAMTRVFERVIADAIAEDDSRVIQMSSAMDFLGRLKIYNLHYPKSWQSFPDYPNTAYWIDHAFLFPWYGPKKVLMPAWKWKQDKPLYVGEFTCVFGPTPDSQACIVGDVAFSCEDDGNSLVREKLWPIETMAYRRRDVSGFCAWAAMFTEESEGLSLDDWLGRPENVALACAMRPLAVLCHSFRSQVMAGEDIELEWSMHNDTRNDHVLSLTIEGFLDGNMVWSDEMVAAKFGPAENRCFCSTHRVPNVESRRDLLLKASLLSGGGVADLLERTIEVWPIGQEERWPDGCLFFDPGGKLARLSSSSGSLKNFAASRDDLERLPKYHTLWLSFIEGQVRRDDWESMKAIVKNWVRAGGCLVLDHPPAEVCLDLSICLSNGKGFASDERLEITYAYCVSPHHPILDGLCDRDFALWGRDYYVAKRCWNLPQKGNFRPLLAAGADLAGLTASPLLELRHGAGSYIVSSLELWSKLKEAPIVAEVIRRLASYAPKWREASAGACVGPASFRRLSEVGWKGKNSDWRDALTCDIIIVDGMCLPYDAIPEILGAVRKGAVVCLHDLAQEEIRRVLSEIDLNAIVRGWQLGDGHDIIRHGHRFSDGMTNNNLYWTIGRDKLPPWTKARLHPEPASACIELAGQDGTSSLTGKGSVLVVAFGEGTLVIDCLRWQDEEIDEPARARRYLVCLLTNLGIPLTSGDLDYFFDNLETEAERRERGAL